MPVTRLNIVDKCEDEAQPTSSATSTSFTSDRASNRFATATRACITSRVRVVSCSFNRRCNVRIVDGLHLHRNLISESEIAMKKLKRRIEAMPDRARAAAALA
jgi:hypothetical protein